MSRATFAYGRFNPPTESGHGKLIDKVKSHAKSTGGQHYIFASHSQDAEKNPLRHAHKVAVMKKMFPGTNVAREIHPNLIGVMKHLEKQGHTHVTMIAGSDRVPEFHKLLHKYNGKEYNFKKIEVKSAGQRDPDAEGSEGMSASKLRGLVKAGKRREFISHYTNKKLGAEIHDKVKRAMNESRALFLLGGPGSGKDYVINNILTHFNIVEVQMDQILNGSVSHLIESGTNLMINAPVDMEKIALVRATLGEGYDTSFALVSVTNKVSRDRNELRARPMNESVRIRKWLDAEQSTEVFENVFKFDNSLNLSEASQRELTGFQMQIEAFLKFMIENGYVFEKKVPEPTGDLKKACWKGYTAVGMKMKNGRKVPNCVPVKEDYWSRRKREEDIISGKRPSRKRIPLRNDYFERRAKMKREAERHNEEVEQVDEGSRYNPDGSPKNVGLKAAQKFGKKEHWKATLGQFAKGAATDDLSKFRYDLSDKKGVKEATDKESKITQVKDILGKPGFKVTNRRLRQTKSFNNMKDAQAYADRGKKNEALELGTKETLQAYLRATPGASIDTTPTLQTKSVKKGKITPPSDLNARQAGSGGYIGGLTQTFPESVSLEEAVQYHLENKIPFAENIFRPGSDMFFELIREAKNLYANGEYTPADEYEQEVLESDLGETAMYEGMEVLLDFPFLEEEKMPKHVRKLSKVEADEEEAVKVSIKKEETKLDEEQKPHGKKIGTVNGYHIHIDLDAPKEQRYLAYHNEYNYISHSAPTEAEITEKSKKRKESKPTPKRTAHDDWRDAKARERRYGYRMKEETCCDDCDDLNESDIKAEYKQLMTLSIGELRNRIKQSSRVVDASEFTTKDRAASHLLRSKHGDKKVSAAFGLNEEEGSSDPTKGKGIGKPWREGGGGAVYVRTGDGGVKKVRFSQSGMAKKFRDPARLKSFMARHNCLGNKDKTSASYWACRYPRFFSNSGQLWW